LGTHGITLIKEEFNRGSLHEEINKPLRRYEIPERLVMGTFLKALFIVSSRRIRFGGEISDIF
jgi:hypothetical protein